MKNINLKPFLRVDGQISLHLARPELAEAIFGAIDENRSYLRRWLPWVDYTKTVEDTKSFIQESKKHNSEGSRLTAFLEFDGELAGSLGVVNFNKEHHKCEIGYWLREDLQGKGIITKALATFAEYLFLNKSMNRLEILVLVGNHRSSAIPKRLGFQCEGVLREAVLMYHVYHDAELYSLLKRDWEATRLFEKNQKI